MNAFIHIITMDFRKKVSFNGILSELLGKHGDREKLKCLEGFSRTEGTLVT